MRRGFFVFILVSICAHGLAQDTIDLEPIVIEKDDPCLSPLSFGSVEQALDYFSGLDLKERSSYGIQQDLSIRGSIFEDNRVLVNGVEVNDPQTGHFSLEIPFTAADLEDLELDKNRQAVSFILKKPKARGLFLESSFGEHALFTELLSANFSLGSAKNRISLEHKKSKGARQDTDFETYNATFHSYYQGQDSELELIYGFLKKDFGANGFYAAPVFMQEEEHTIQHFSSLRYLIKDDYYEVEVTPFFRRHDDDFILNRHNPSFFNAQHTTYIYGSDLKVDLKGLKSFLVSGFRQEKIASSNLGKHRRNKIPLLLGLDPLKIGDFLIEAEAGGDYYSDRDWLESLHLGASFILSDETRLKFLFDRAYRVPSFTELFYFSPANQGNPGLGEQRTDNFQWSFILSQENLDLDISFFLRKQADTIDWVRNSQALPWQARNVGSVDARGVDIDLEFIPECKFFSAIGLSYSFLDQDRDFSFNHSKYAFNILKHKVLFSFKMPFNDAFKLMPAVIFEKPLSGASRVIFNLRAVCKLSDDLSLFFEADNLLDRRYQELEGVAADPRWLRAGFTLDI